MIKGLLHSNQQIKSEIKKIKDINGANIIEVKNAQIEIFGLIKAIIGKVYKLIKNELIKQFTKTYFLEMKFVELIPLIPKILNKNPKFFKANGLNKPIKQILNSILWFLVFLNHEKTKNITARIETNENSFR